MWRRIAIIATGICCLALLTLCLLVLMFDQRQYTYDLGPPPYPAARVRAHQEWGGTGGVREMTLYSTPDDISTVHRVLDQQMPGFTGTPTTGYSNTVCNTNMLVDILDHLLASAPFARCVGVDIYRESSSTETLIRVSAQWSAG